MLTFAGCTVDLPARRLLRDGDVQHLEPRAFDLLVFLLENRHRVVPKEELLDTVWGDRWVSEAALTTQIKEIRQATGDSGTRQDVIRTVRGRGYQFVAPLADAAPDAAPADLPPADSAPADSSDAMSDWTPTVPGLIGRDRDLGEVSMRLRAGHVVTLVGPGGVGKTTLARSLLATQSSTDRFPDGVIHCDLTVLASADELIAVVARAAAVTEASSDQVVATLGARRALLLLDDADDYVPQVADLAHRLTEEGSALAIVVTSRERLGVASEQLWPLLPLTGGDARTLLVTRAQQLAPLGSVVSASDAELDALASAVDGLPLALEMVASASAFLGPAELLEATNAHSELLSAPRRDAPLRHRTLDELVSQSLAGLADEERRALCALTSFAGAFTTTDAARVVSSDGSGQRLLRALADRSLVAPAPVGASGSPRFQLLRVVRRAVLAELPEVEHCAARDRHAAVVAEELKLADALLRTGDELRGARRIDELDDEARAAHSWARATDAELALQITDALHLYCHSRWWAEPAQWLMGWEQGREDPRAVVALASQASLEGRLDDATQLADSMRDHSNSRIRGWALEVLSDAALFRDDFDAAERWGRQLLDLGRASGDPYLVTMGTTNTALALMYADKTDDALDLVDTTMSTPSPPLAPSQRAWLAYACGEAIARAGRTGADPHLVTAMELADSVGSYYVAGMAELTLATVQTRRGEASAAATSFAHLIQSFRLRGNVTHLDILLRNVVPLLRGLGESRAAVEIGAWVLDPTGRGNEGPDVDAVRRVLDEVAAETPEATTWVSDAAHLSVAQVVDVALTALRAQAGPTASSGSPQVVPKH